jgi:hypothetical protein
VFSGILILAAVSTPVKAGVIRSPDVEHTGAFSSMIDHELRWIRSEKALVASVTFSNVHYVSREEARRDDRFDFFLPGVRLDARNGIFYDPQGVPVAVYRHELIGSGVHLVPGAKIRVWNHSGTVHLTLVASGRPQPGLRWVETDEAQVLPNGFG